MAFFGFNKKKLDELLKNLRERGEQIEDRVEFGLQQWAFGTEEEIGRQILAAGALDQGQLYGATSDTGPWRESNFIRIIVFNNSEHAMSMEFGHPGGKQPPFTAIASWATRKGLTTIPVNSELSGEYLKAYKIAKAIMENKKRGGKGTGKKPQAGKRTAIDQLVRDMMIIRGIRMKIARDGYKGRFFFTKAFEIRRNAFPTEMRQYLSI